MGTSSQPLRPAPGTLLVASPRLLDPNFMHAVVLICEVQEQGAFGVMVNRPGGKRVSMLGSDAPVLAGRDDRLWSGGPVSLDTLQVVHRVGDSVPGSHPVAPGILLGGDQTVLRHALGAARDNEDRVRFILGYSGWGAGQLEAELQEGAWVVCPATEEFVFDEHPETLWRRVLTARGGRFAQLAHIPPDPTWN